MEASELVGRNIEMVLPRGNFRGFGRITPRTDWLSALMC
jgi:hypothetical protein